MALAFAVALRHTSVVVEGAAVEVGHSSDIAVEVLDEKGHAFVAASAVASVVASVVA